MPSTIINPVASIGNTNLVGQTVIKNHDRNDSLVEYKTLIAYHGGSNNFATFRELGVTSGGYVVPSGKIFIAVGLHLRANFGGAGSAVHLQGGSTDVGFDSATGPSNPDTTLTTNGQAVYTSSGAGSVATLVSCFLRITVGRYIFAYIGSVAAHYILYGYEVDTTVTDLNP